MRWSRFLRGMVVVLMTATSVGGVMSFASADNGGENEGTFTVSPTSVFTNSSTQFTLSFQNAAENNGGGGGDGDGEGDGDDHDGDGDRPVAPRDGGSNNPIQCLKFTLTNFSGLSGLSVSLPSSGWTASFSGNQITEKGSPALAVGAIARVLATAVAPGSIGSNTWTLHTFQNLGCTTDDDAYSANVNVTQAPVSPAKNNTTTVLSCTTTTPTVGVADSCTATVRDLGGGSFAISHPTGPVGLSTSGGGGFASSSCSLVALASPNTDSSSCTVNYTATSTGNQSLFAAYGGDSQHNTSNNGTGLSISVQPAAPPGAPGRFQPDELIRRMRAFSFLGNDIYNGTGGRQTTHFVARHGRSRTSIIEIQNDGNQVDTLIVTGQGHRPGFTVHYYAGLRNITNDVVSRVFTLSNMAPGETSQIRMVVTVTRHARPGLVRSWQVEARSTKDPTKRDVVKMKVGVARH